jgi:hypothetical protein
VALPWCVRNTSVLSETKKTDAASPHAALLFAALLIVQNGTPCASEHLPLAYNARVFWLCRPSGGQKNDPQLSSSRDHSVTLQTSRSSETVVPICNMSTNKTPCKDLQIQIVVPQYIIVYYLTLLIRQRQSKICTAELAIDTASNLGWIPVPAPRPKSPHEALLFRPSGGQKNDPKLSSIGDHSVIL